MWSVETLASALRMGVPILLAGLGAVYSERSGVVNIGLEGMMITGAFMGALGSYFVNPLFGMLLGICGGLCLALIHAVASVTFRVDQIVSGVALNLLAAGLVRFLSLLVFAKATTSPHVDRLPAVDIPLLDRVEALHPLVTSVSPVVILALLLVPITGWVLYRTVFGLRLRSCGENPFAADSLGINVPLMRYAGVLISGGLAGLAGAYLAVELTGMYVEGMTQGKGFIALAAMVFGNWSALGTMGAALLFGSAEAVSFRAVVEAVPYQFIKMIPYVITVAVLAGIVGRAAPPEADGVSFERSEQ